MSVPSQPCSVNWFSDAWFSKFHASDLTEDFKSWWLDYYGTPDVYANTEDEQQEYWTRCAFALRGWLASRAPNPSLQVARACERTLQGFVGSSNKQEE